MKLLYRLQLQWEYWKAKDLIVKDPTLSQEEKIALLRLLRRMHIGITKGGQRVN